MDPVTVLGIAAAVVQFVSFAGKLLSGTVEIHAASSGVSAEISGLSEICSKLSALNKSLRDASHQVARALASSTTTTTNGDPLWKAATTPPQRAAVDASQAGVTSSGPPDLQSSLRDSYHSLEGLVTSCESDCSRLSSVVGKLTAQTVSRWSCFRVALKSLWHRDDIAQIESRLQKVQQLILLEMAKIANIQHGVQFEQLALNRRQSETLGIHLADRLTAIESQLQKLEPRDLLSTSALGELSRLQIAMSELDVSGKKLSREIEIIRSLSFESRTARHKCIPRAHRRTFEWVFQKHDQSFSEFAQPTIDEDSLTIGNGMSTAQSTARPDVAESSLLNWMRHEKQIFWVSGKPGSGKSTFMKFVAGDPRTRAALTEWASPDPILIASHYFWSQGTDMQKSQNGLLRSLLYDILRCCPELTEVVCATRWDRQQGEAEEPWTYDELRAAMIRVSQQNRIAHKICFFIDGLDEYSGNHEDLCKDLKSLQKSPSIKICASSRFWNVFEQAFGGGHRHKMYIHELTRGDILKYASDTLRQHSRWKQLASSSIMADSLLRSIVDKAQGVFFWVFLVTRLLQDGLTNNDSFSDLRRSLESYPSELGPFFRQMLEKAPPFYREKTAEALQIALAAKEPLDAAIYSFHEEPQDGEFGSDIGQRRKRIIDRLNGWCRCLLEPNFLLQIDFLHRTVADFLRETETADFLNAGVSTGFNPNIAIIRAYTAWMDTAGSSDKRFSLSRPVYQTGSHLQAELSRTVRTMLSYALSAEYDKNLDKERLDDTIGELEELLRTITNPDGVVSKVGDDAISRGEMSNLFLELVLETPLMDYLSRKISERPRYLSVFEMPALIAVLQYPKPKKAGWPVKCYEKMDLLLRHGHSVNEQRYKSVNWTKERFLMATTESVGANETLYSDQEALWDWLEVEKLVVETSVPDGGGETIWQWLVSESMPIDSWSQVSKGVKFLATLKAKLFQLFLQHGADPNARFGTDWSVFHRLIALSHEVPREEEHQNSYLQVLSSFISHGARLGRPHWSKASQEGQVFAAHLATEIPFYDGIEASMRSGIDIKFLAAIALRLHRLAIAAEWPLNRFKGVLRQISCVNPMDTRVGIQSSESVLNNLLAESQQDLKRKQCDLDELNAAKRQALPTLVEATKAMPVYRPSKPGFVTMSDLELA